MSAYIQTARPVDVSSAAFAAEAARSAAGRKEGDFRVLDDARSYSSDIEAVAGDYYKRKVLEFRAGQFKPTPMRSFAGAVSHYERFLTERVPLNIANWRKEYAKKDKCDMAVACIPFIYKVPHPTDAERQAYMARWNDDGDLQEKFQAACAGLKVALLPQIIHGDKPGTMVQFSLLMLTDASAL